MPSRRKPDPTKSSPPGPSQRSRQESRPDNLRRRALSGGKTAKRWRRDSRPRIVRAAVSATEGIGWSAELIEAVLEEMYVDDHFEDLLGAPGRLRARQYPQAVAVALILRHSWHPDDLAGILKRLGLKMKETISP